MAFVLVTGHQDASSSSPRENFAVAWSFYWHWRMGQGGKGPRKVGRTSWFIGSKRDPTVMCPVYTPKKGLDAYCSKSGLVFGGDVPEPEGWGPGIMSWWQPSWLTPVTNQTAWSAHAESKTTKDSFLNSLNVLYRESHSGYWDKATCCVQQLGILELASPRVPQSTPVNNPLGSSYLP